MINYVFYQIWNNINLLIQMNYTFWFQSSLRNEFRSIVSNYAAKWKFNNNLLYIKSKAFINCFLINISSDQIGAKLCHPKIFMSKSSIIISEKSIFNKMNMLEEKVSPNWSSLCLSLIFKYFIFTQIIFSIVLFQQLLI